MLPKHPGSGRRSGTESRAAGSSPRAPPALLQSAQSQRPALGRTCQSGRRRNAQRIAGETLAQGCVPVKNVPFNAPTANVEVCSLGSYTLPLYTPVHDKGPSPAPGWAVDTHVGCTTDGVMLLVLFSKDMHFHVTKPHH